MFYFEIFVFAIICISVHVQVVPLHGLKEERLGNGNTLLHTLAEQLGRDFITLPAPWLMQTVEAYQLITREKCVSSVIQLAESVDVALAGIGALNENASETLWNDWIGKDALKALREAGAVASSSSVLNFFNNSTT